MKRARVVVAAAPAIVIAASAVAAPANRSTPVRRKSRNHHSRPARPELGEAGQAVDDEVGLLDDRARPLVGATPTLTTASRRAVGGERLERVESIQVGRVVTAEQRPAARRLATSARTARPLSICTGGRTSSTFRPQWVVQPGGLRLLRDPLELGARRRPRRARRASGSGDRALVLDPDPKQPELAVVSRSAAKRARGRSQLANAGISPGRRPARAARRRAGPRRRCCRRPPAAAPRPPAGRDAGDQP